MAAMAIDSALMDHAIGILDDLCLTKTDGEAFDIVKMVFDEVKRERETLERWSSAQIGALMIAATEAIDAVERVWWNAHVCPPPEDLAKQVAEWRAAVSREETKP